MRTTPQITARQHKPIPIPRQSGVNTICLVLLVFVLPPSECVLKEKVFARQTPTIPTNPTTAATHPASISIVLPLSVWFYEVRIQSEVRVILKPAPATPPKRFSSA
jgi:hypothetical protein